MTHVSQRKVILWFNVILAMTNGDLVAAYDILLREAVSRSLFFACSYGATRCAETVGGYLLGPVADIPIICDYIVTSPSDEIMERGSKLVAGGVGIVSTATSEFVYPEIALGAAGELVNMCEGELRDGIAQVMTDSNITAAWMEKYILGDEILEKLRGGATFFEPNQNRYFIIEIIAGVLIVTVTITLIRCRSKIGKFFKKIHPKKLYASFKTKRDVTFLKDKEKLELLYVNKFLNG